MKQRQAILTQILDSRFGKGEILGNSIEPGDLVKAGVMKEVFRIYRRLGGILNQPPLSFGEWDICLNGFIVELDEEQHFNRYRAITLDSYLYHIEDGFDIFSFKKYCVDNEQSCLAKSSWGKYWTSPSTEKQFGSPGPKGNLVGNGSPRWKQRAFYDYLRDLYSMIYKIPLIRISVYDKIQINKQSKTVSRILSETLSDDQKELVNFIERKSQDLL
jgi:hypothetical protein